ncbi:MAG: glycosyltransferase [Verrucomicrobiaceae bacterium]|nr:MAG: glycosyltransferase [Verrucomicrobiaceae bacterium]
MTTDSLNAAPTPKVSVAMVTYRHAPFLAQAIESVLNQQTDFPVELVIGEDCSPDRTREIAREYAARYPDRIRLQLPDENIGLTKNLSRTISACRGQYVAWLEGDDYWTSPHKLQTQADYLDRNSDCAWCFTRAEVVDAEGAIIPTGSTLKEVKPKYTLEEYLRLTFHPRACTVMFRHRLFPEFPKWFYELPTGDMPLHVLNSQHGDIGFIDEVMSAYRIHPGGVWSHGIAPGEWSAKTPEQLRYRAERAKAMVHLYETLDRNLGGAYRKILRRQLGIFATQWTDLNRELGDYSALRVSAWKALVAQPSVYHLIRPKLIIALLQGWVRGAQPSPAK